jgi:hypothetical protein
MYICMYRTSTDSPPPLKKVNILWLKYATASPLTGTSRREQRVQAGLGLVVQGQAELGLGGQGLLGR